MIKNILKVLISNIVVMSTSFINTLIIPKFLSINGYAEYQTFMLYISYIGLLTLGFHSGLFVKYGGTKKENIDRAQYKSEINIIIWSQLLFSLIIFVIGILIRDTLLICATLCILTSNFVSVYKYLYQAWNMFTRFSLINIVQSLGFSLCVLIWGIIRGGLNSKDIIDIYVVLNLICFVPVFLSYIKEVSGIKRAAIFSTENYRIFETGFLLILGSAANVIFHSIDKFFIKGLFNAYDFSMYCFAITLLNVMNVFISAISQPMYLRLLSELDNIQERKMFKELLMCFGGLSGCAYYVVAIVIRYFLPEYTESLSVVAILFAIFPAVAVINCLYINLYKATNQIKKYLKSLGVVILSALILNVLGIVVYHDYLMIAFATTICYYAWLIYSSKDFDGLHIYKKDLLFLVGYFFIYFILTQLENCVIGIISYLFIITLWEVFIYRETCKEIYSLIKR